MLTGEASSELRSAQPSAYFEQAGGERKLNNLRSLASRVTRRGICVFKASGIKFEEVGQ
jgi:hypothetical protein